MKLQDAIKIDYGHDPDLDDTPLTWKEILAGISIVVVFGALVLGGVFLTHDQKLNGLTAENALISNLQQLEENYKTEGKYQHIKKQTSGDITYQVDEHLAPDGKTGYVIYLEQQRDDGLYTKRVGYGIVSDLTQDWTRKSFVNSTTTK
jgi:hypothetical protein